MIHFISMALGGDGYLNFMGNEVNFHFFNLYTAVYLYFFLVRSPRMG